MAKRIDTIPVPEKAYEAIAAIIDLGVERVTAFAEAARKQKAPVVQVSHLRRLIAEWAESTGVDEAVVQKAVFDVLLPANAIRVENDLACEEFLKAFERSVEERASDDWKTKYLERWPETVTALKPLFAPDNFLSLAIKTCELLFSHPALFQDANVLSELRPVYDESAEVIRSLLLTNTLVLTYLQNGSSETLHVTLDSDDLKRLANVVARAGRKNKAAQDAALQWHVEMLTVASEKDDNDE